MIRQLCLTVLLVASTSAFVLQKQTLSWGRTLGDVRSPPYSRLSKVYMFNVDDDQKKSESSASTTTPPTAPALATVDDMQSTESKETPVVRNIVKDMNTGEIKEVKWVDPAMRANTRPWDMSWWAWILFGFPFVVLADDVFHFLPTEGPLGFLGRI
jgi:hypothetical protein